jgi:hypothetical protein
MMVCRIELRLLYNSIACFMMNIIGVINSMYKEIMAKAPGVKRQ